MDSIRPEDNVAVCCFRFYWTEDLPFTLDSLQVATEKHQPIRGYDLDSVPTQALPVNLKNRDRKLARHQFCFFPAVQASDCFFVKKKTRYQQMVNNFMHL